MNYWILVIELLNYWIYTWTPSICLLWIEILKYFVFRFHQLEGPKMVGVPGDPVKTQSKAKTQWRICEKLLLESLAICNAKAKHLANGNAVLLAVKVSRQRTKKLVYFSLTSYRNGFSSLSLKFTINKRLITYPKKFPLYAWVSAKTLNFEYTYPQHFEWNSLSKRLREAFWNLKHYCSNLISWMYRCNQFSFFLW